jgi:hypothetical protein
MNTNTNNTNMNINTENNNIVSIIKDKENFNWTGDARRFLDGEIDMPIFRSLCISLERLMFELKRERAEARAARKANSNRKVSRKRKANVEKKTQEEIFGSLEDWTMDCLSSEDFNRILAHPENTGRLAGLARKFFTANLLSSKFDMEDFVQEGFYTILSLSEESKEEYIEFVSYGNYIPLVYFFRYRLLDCWRKMVRGLKVETSLYQLLEGGWDCGKEDSNIEFALMVKESFMKNPLGDFDKDEINVLERYFTGKKIFGWMYAERPVYSRTRKLVEVKPSIWQSAKEKFNSTFGWIIELK